MRLLNEYGWEQLVPETPPRALILGFCFVISEVVMITSQAQKNKGQRQTLLISSIRDKLRLQT